MLCARSTVAWAENAEDRESARQLLDRGDEQEEKGELEGALASYRAAHELMHVPTTGFEVARISAKLGKLVEARDVALEVIRMPTMARESKPFKVARAAAESLARELAPQIPSLRLELTPEAEQRMRAFLADNTTEKHGGHHYTWADTELDLDEWRERSRKYQEYFGVESEDLA